MLHGQKLSSKKPASRLRPPFLSRERWIKAARGLVETKGVNSVKVDHLARQLKVTRGSFYFHFNRHGELLEAILQEWRHDNCLPFWELERSPNLGGPALYEAVTDLWLGEGTFSSKLELAVRDWSRGSKTVAEEVQAADEARIGLLRRALLDMGFEQQEAIVRARIAYLHQIGYFSVHFSEPRSERIRFVPLYLKVLTGLDGWKER